MHGNRNQPVEEFVADNETSVSNENGDLDSTSNEGQRLFLTPLINAGNLEEAKSASKVGPIGADYEVPSYSGYITVNPQYNSNLFFWFVPSLKDPENDPEFLQQFFTLFGELAQNDFYIAGESYAGKYVPTVGATLHENADTMRVKINFRGIAYGNGLTDPINMMDFGSFIYGIGLIDRGAADYMMRVAKDAVDMVRAGHTVESGVMMDRLFFGILTHETFFKNVTGFEYYYNYLTDKEPEGSRAYKAFVQKPEIRRALHVGQQGFSMGRELVAAHFITDIMRSAVPQFTVVLENGYKVLVYSGHLDICVPTTHTEKFLANLAWSHADRWSHAPRHIWRSADGRRLYGYKKSVENLNFVVVRNGGHVLPYDQPEAMFELITAFIDDEPPFSAQGNLYRVGDIRVPTLACNLFGKRGYRICVR
ncbi:hypothetical protein MTO96_008683 [Rhipicephalus appendiculatus]